MNAFSNVDSEEKIYREQPESSIVNGKGDWIYCLRKVLYGARQSSRE